MLLNLVIAILIAVLFMALAFFYKKPWGLMGIAFLLPLAKKEAVLAGRGIALIMSFVSIAIVAYFFGRLLSGKLSSRGRSPLVYKVHLIFLCFCLGVSSLIPAVQALPSNITYFGGLSTDLTGYLSVTIAAILLYILIQFEVDSELVWLNCVKAFLWSAVFMAVMYVIIHVFHLHLPEFLSPTWTVKLLSGKDEIVYAPPTSGANDVFFSGFIGHIENFAEYLFVIFAFGTVLLLGKLRKMTDLPLGLCCMAISVAFSFPTAVKAYPIMLGLFLVLLALFGASGRNKLTIIVLLLIGALGFFSFKHALSESFYAKRFSVVAERVHGVKTADSGVLGNFANIIGRGDIVDQFWPVIETGGIVGIGPVIVSLIGRSAIPYHNLYYSLLLSFGMAGALIYLTYFLRVIIRLWISKRYDAVMKGRAAAICIMMAVLFLEQVKVSAFRVPYGVLSFWFILGLASSLIRLMETKNKEKRIEGTAPIP